MDLKSVKLILGSASPRRKKLLEELGWEIEVRVKSTNEEIPNGLVREEIAIHLAEMKASAFDGTLKQNELLITADTIVCLRNDILNKPANEKEAQKMLGMLSGNSHQVYTGVCLTMCNKRKCFYEESTVLFEALSESDIKKYIHEFRPYDKAGAYGAQECLPEGMNPCSIAEKEFLSALNLPNYLKASLDMSDKKHIPMIKEIQGSFFNVMGLPVAKLSEQIREFIDY
ncbi:MAG TPA: Maf family protein [Bacteroidia bacterium]|nr:Maf family protein [Bacteroidia bacterium]HNS13481.1 Maf family protein [Bacteroidia bacterium]